MISCAYWLKEWIFLKCSFYPKTSRGSVRPLSKFQCHFFRKIEKKNPLNLDETTKDWLAKAILGKCQCGGIILPNFNLYITLTTW